MLPNKVLVCLQNYFKDCVFDLCELDGARPILCEAIEAYVNECQDRGVNIGTWRNKTFCREFRVKEWSEEGCLHVEEAFIELVTVY